MKPEISAPGSDIVAARASGTRLGTPALLQQRPDWTSAQLHRGRIELIAHKQPADLRGWLDCHITAVFTQAELRHSHYLGFLAMLLHHRRWEVFLNLSAEMEADAAELQQTLNEFLAPLPTSLRVHRIRQAMRLIVRATSDRERARTLNPPVLPLVVEIGDLVDTVTAFLTAPAAAPTLTALAEQRWAPGSPPHHHGPGLQRAGT
ncbi:hypothetical protein [Crossiella sp. CA198]|uniref:hypothetical protein n=1 Tax=Crossiella sp. CA198 TaxID=3455607 RepID=UPI003F8D1982